MMSKLKYLYLIALNLILLNVAAQDATFTMAPPDGCAPLNTFFTQTDATNSTTWSWTFGDGSSSIIPNPGKIYPNPGHYEVCLTVTNGGAGTNTYCDSVFVYPDPIINFVADDTLGCDPLTVTFTNLTITETGIATVQWLFGDAGNSTVIDPVHTYTTLGTGQGIFPVTLSVTDNSGCVSQDTKSNYIEVTVPPVINFTATNTQSCSAPLTVNFTNTTTNTSGSTTYRWKFGDGFESLLTNPTHTYMTNNTSYDVTLIVNKNGCIDSITKPNFVNIQSQNSDFTVSQTVLCAGQSANFTDISVLTAASWSWDFGTGNAADTSSLQNPSFSYTTPGTYTVTMVAHLPGCDDTEIKVNLITVNPNPTTPTLASNKTDTCGFDFLVDFTSTADAGVTYLWNFGGAPGIGDPTLANPTYLFQGLGNFNISLQVTNAFGCSASVNSPSLININPPNALFQLDSTTGCSPKLISFTDMSSSPNGIVSWFWDFGTGIIGDTSNLQDPSFFYSDTGSYDISLVVVDGNGCRDTTTASQALNLGESFNVDFSVLPTPACKLDTIFFTNNTDTGTISGVTWSWQIDNTEFSTEYEENYLFSDTGFFNITLEATFLGCKSDTTVDSIIRIYPPIADFTIAFDCDNPLDAEFQDNSIGPETWEWFIDGVSTYNVDTVLHTFIDSGIYTIKLEVNNLTYGCLDTIEQDITIVNPSVEFSYDDTIGCPPFSVNFSDSSQQVIGWDWYSKEQASLIYNWRSSTQNPTLIFTNQGIYDVMLVVTSLHGCKDTIVKPQIITVLSSTPDFFTNNISGCRPFNTTFTDISTTSGGDILHWSWSFGDFSPFNPATDTLQNPSHTYNAVGSFDVTLQITDSAGCVSTITKPQYVTSTGPTPSFTNPGSRCVNSPVNFTNTSVSLGGTITNYLWNFGDGNSSTDQNPTHSYANQGYYDVSLYILDDNGCDSTILFPNTIFIDSLVIDFTASATTSNCPPFIVNFIELASPSANNFLWKIGTNSYTFPNPTVDFQTVGNLDITLIVSNAVGCIDSLTKPNYISIQGPVATLSSGPNLGCINHDVQYQITNTNAFKIDWDFGSGNLDTGTYILDTTITYSTVDTFKTIVVLEDSTGCRVAYEFDSVMTASANADFSNSIDYVCAPGTVSFTDLSTSSLPITSWNWNFGDGNTTTINNPNNTYTDDGIYNVRLIIENAICADTAYITNDIVADTSTNALFSILPPAIVCPPIFFNFTDLSSSDSSIVSWSWDFGDGQVDITQSPPSIPYNNDGDFLVTLDIVSDKGCTSHFEETITIHPTPVFNFDLDSMDLCINTDSTLNSLGDAAFTWTPSTNLSCADCSDPTITANSSETYFVHSVNTFGCEYDDTLHFIMHGTPPLSVTNDRQVARGETIGLHAFSSSTTNFDWSPSENLDCNNCADNIFTADETTTFIVSLTDDFGCINQDSILVEVFNVCDGNSIFFPNIFTPNNDSKNDLFKASTVLNLIPDINFYRIFDRWGKLVFETTNIKEAWDGNDQNGIQQNNGVYVYVLDVICPNSPSLVLQGNVTLLR